MAYFVMVCEGEYPVVPIETIPDQAGEWRSGSPISDPVATPLVFTLSTKFRGSPKAMYYAEWIPVMRDDVIAALGSAGVDNIEYFDAVLKNPKTKEEHSNYKAYNIVGAVAAADKGKSKRMPGSTSTMGDVDFDSLVIDEKKTRGLLLFRLAESLGAIVVHEKVRKAIEIAEIPGFVFYGPGEWSG